MTHKIYNAILLTILLGLVQTSIMGQKIQLTEENWKVVDIENNSPLDLITTNYKGKEAIYLGRHKMAVIEGIDLENFVLELDIAAKAMPGIGFRAEDLFNYEFFYCRIFSGGKETALQYGPIFNGAMPWQLYNYPLYETAANFKPEEWFHLRIEVYGNAMRVFIGEDELPEMEVELLHNGVKRGSIMLINSFAEAYYANIRLEELEEPFQINTTENSNEFLKDWQISEQLTGNIYNQRQFYQTFSDAEKEHDWRKIEADKNGIVNLAQYFDHPKESVFAKTNIVSETVKTVTMAFDYTQVLMISLNDQILFYGRELDTENFMRMMDGEEKVDLKFKEGDNKLVFWIRSDDEWQDTVDNPAYLGRKQAMNWGFVARLE